MMREYQTHTIPTALALTAPAVRMVVVVVHTWRSREDGAIYDRHQVLPVLAIQSMTRQSWDKEAPRDEDPEAFPGAEGMESRGWYYDARTSEYSNHDLIIYDEDDEFFGDLGFVARMTWGDGSAHRIVVAPWPFEQDAERLAPMIEDVRERARANLVRVEASRAKVEASP